MSSLLTGLFRLPASISSAMARVPAHTAPTAPPPPPPPFWLLKIQNCHGDMLKWWTRELARRTALPPGWEALTLRPESSLVSCVSSRTAHERFPRAEPEQEMAPR
ncbi:uncharacterized protein BDZ83DRAFT_606536 [Colletotrichum acutatum]|uniref:Uncharacterized protein n=1 Tax=Glomerella acutata TaxID=27357 RepID=A0AAD8XKL2_GLOAC|nr:uncharacterized protein BDZ83DRAFT_606536 [Colletotrichum acutatum]KAK1729059.1 hypothetical protein BDZ83DRAFT_606536 [Colletotrichum acutatum]